MADAFDVATSFNEQFDQHGAWRREFALRLRLLADWLRERDLLNDAVQERLHRVETQMRSDKVMVAFVAEFSRGKSELINAIFFASYGRRIMPTSAGRTTMCPTELGYDADVSPCLRLLPIQTRLQALSLMDWRSVPDQWQRIELDVNNPEQLATALQQVVEVIHVSREEAAALGFWHDDLPDDNPPLDAAGMVEIPKWRHALINIAHPLLKQGLVILDTPGLNAIGAEPELTVSLIPQAHAVVFILAADTGVTRSDLAIWREHLSSQDNTLSSRLVVLNKIDTLWDELSTTQQIQAQIERQREQSASILGLSTEQVIPVSAQKGLVAKINNDTELLQASHLPDLEKVLGLGLLGQRQGILQAAVSASIAELSREAQRVIHIRQRDLTEQMMELNGLRGKNTAVIRHMRSRVEQENGDFDVSGSRIHAVRSLHVKLLKDVFELLGNNTLKMQLQDFHAALRQPGIKFGVRKTYMATFERLREGLQKAQALNAEIEAMLSASFRQLNAEYGFSLQAPKVPDLSGFERDLEAVQQSHLQYLGLGNALKLAQSGFVDRLVRALATRLRVIFESALSEVEMWNKSAASQLDAQLRERRRTFGHRIDAIDRIQQAASGLDERIQEIEAQEAALGGLMVKLQEYTGGLMSTQPAPALVRTPAQPAELKMA
jgi:hypothetical protein